MSTRRRSSRRYSQYSRMTSCSGTRSRRRSSTGCTLYSHLIRSRTMRRHSLRSQTWSRRKRRRDTPTISPSSTCSMRYASRCITRFQIINESTTVMIFLFLIKLSDIDSIHVVDFIDEIIFPVLFIDVVSLFLLLVVHVFFLCDGLTRCLLMRACLSSSSRCQ
jgi:hypothetical protein